MRFLSWRVYHNVYLLKNITFYTFIHTHQHIFSFLRSTCRLNIISILKYFKTIFKNILSKTFDGHSFIHLHPTAKVDILLDYAFIKCILSPANIFQVTAMLTKKHKKIISRGKFEYIRLDNVYYYLIFEYIYVCKIEHWTS